MDESRVAVVGRGCRNDTHKRARCNTETPACPPSQAVERVTVVLICWKEPWAGPSLQRDPVGAFPGQIPATSMLEKAPFSPHPADHSPLSGCGGVGGRLWAPWQEPPQDSRPGLRGQPLPGPPKATWEPAARVSENGKHMAGREALTDGGGGGGAPQLWPGLTQALGRLGSRQAPGLNAEAQAWGAGGSAARKGRVSEREDFLKSKGRPSQDCMRNFCWPTRACLGLGGGGEWAGLPSLKQHPRAGLARLPNWALGIIPMPSSKGPCTLLIIKTSVPLHTPLASKDVLVPGMPQASAMASPDHDETRENRSAFMSLSVWPLQSPLCPQSGPSSSLGPGLVTVRGGPSKRLCS